MNRSCLFIFLAASLAAPGASAKDTPHGGSGGTPGSTFCGSDQVMVGIQANGGAYVDSIQPLCSKYNADGSWSGSILQAPRVGGTGGSAATRKCSNGHAVIGIGGRADAYLNAIKLICKPVTGVGSGGVTYGTGQYNAGAPTPFVGGSDGIAFDSDYCGSNEAAKGFDLRSGFWIDQLTLRCHVPAAPSLAATPLGTVTLTTTPSHNSNPPAVATTSGVAVTINATPGGSHETTYYNHKVISPPDSETVVQQRENNPNKTWTWIPTAVGTYKLKGQVWRIVGGVQAENRTVDIQKYDIIRTSGPYGWYTPVSSGNSTLPVTTRLTKGSTTAEDTIAGHTVRWIVTQSNTKVRGDNKACTTCHAWAAGIDKQGFCDKVMNFDSQPTATGQATDETRAKPQILKDLFNDWKSRNCPD